MVTYHDKIKKIPLQNGILLQVLGQTEHLNVVHWNLPDQAVVERHQHPQEQFGLVIKGGFALEIGDESYTIGEGDSYFVPANVPHRFVALGETEAIDVFSPTRDILAHYT